MARGFVREEFSAGEPQNAFKRPAPFSSPFRLGQGMVQLFEGKHLFFLVSILNFRTFHSHAMATLHESGPDCIVGCVAAYRTMPEGDGLDA